MPLAGGGCNGLTRLGAALAMAALGSQTAACSMGNLFGSSSPEGSSSSSTITSSSGPRSISDRISDFIGGTASKPPPTAASGAPAAEEIDCPPVNIRQGASTLSISDPKATSPTLGLRYQGTIVRTARECTVRDKVVTIRVGVQGRIILGPEGGPGEIKVPLRYALVKEGIEPKAIYSKLYVLPVSIAPGQPNVLFSHVEEQMSVPMPPGSEFDSYVIYIGYDPQGALETAQKKKPTKVAPKPRHPGGVSAKTP